MIPDLSVLVLVLIAAIAIAVLWRRDAALIFLLVIAVLWFLGVLH